MLTHPRRLGEASKCGGLAVGEVQYVLLPDYGGHGTSEPIRVTREMPETFRAEPLLTWSDGTWLVPAEPGK